MNNWYLLDIFARGLIVCIVASIFGLILILKGFKGELSVLNTSLSIPRWLLIVMGSSLQIPLTIYLVLWVFGGALNYAVQG